MVFLDVGDFGADGLPVGHLRLSDPGLHLELAEYPRHQDVEVQLPMPEMISSPVSSFLLDGERRVLQGENVQHFGKLFPLGQGFRLDRYGNDRFGEMHLSRSMGNASTPRVSPVWEVFRPMTTAMSPASTLVDLLGVVWHASAAGG